MLLSSCPVPCDKQMKAACCAAAPGSEPWIDKARAAGLSWLTILNMLAQGLPVLIAFLQQLLGGGNTPAPTPTPHSFASTSSHRPFAALPPSPPVTPADVRADLDNLDSITARVSHDQDAKSQTAADLSTAQSADTAALATLQADQQTQSAALAKLIADAQVVYGTSSS